MAAATTLRVDVLIFGGGAAGLWLLDELVRRGYAALLVEARALGAGQTVASQGIIHGGLKYTLDGAFSPSADAIREMPLVWRDCLAGRREPRLVETRVRAAHCHLWRTDSLASRIGMFGAKALLRVKPVELPRAEWPAALARCPGVVYRLAEQVIDPASFLADLARRHAARLLLASPSEVAWECGGQGQVRAVEIGNWERETGNRETQETSHPGALLGVPGRGEKSTPDFKSDNRNSLFAIRHSEDPSPQPSPRSTGERGKERLRIEPGVVVLAAGEGNASLRERAGLSLPAMQLRPLRMVMLRAPVGPPGAPHKVPGAPHEAPGAPDDAPGAAQRRESPPGLPELNGHCTDGARTRVTITTVRDAAGRTVWQVGGQVAEDGVRLSPPEALRNARRELEATIPGMRFAGLEWATYDVNRAEAASGDGRRPNDVSLRREGNVITAWPTKLALAPRLAEQIAAELPPPAGGALDLAALAGWPRPAVAAPPWDEERAWICDP